MKKVLVGLVLLAGVLVALVLAAPMLLPTDMIKARLADTVRASTGRELRVNGPIRLALVPTLALQADNVTFANAPGGVAPEMARLKSLSAELGLRALLSGRVEVSRLVLTDPAIALEVDRNGRGNWVFDRASVVQPRNGQVPSARAEATRGDIRLDDVRLVGGRVSWLDQRSNTSQVVEKIDLKLSLPGLSGPFTAAGEAIWNGEKVALAITAASPAALLAGKDSALALQMDAAPVHLRLEGTLTGLPPSRTSGTLDLAMPSLRNFAAWAGTPLALPGTGLGPLAIKGHFSRSPGEIAFSEADIALDQMHAKGTLAVSFTGPNSLLKGRLDVDRLDLNPYLPAPATVHAATRAPPPAAAAPAAPTAPVPPAAAPGWNDAPIDLSGLRAVDAELELAAGAILYRELHIDTTQLAVALHGGRLAAELKQVALYQGAGSGRLGVDASGAVPALDLSFALAHVQVGPLLTAAAGMDRLSGIGTFSLAVAGKGASQRALVATLGGKGALDLSDGVVKGVNLPAVAQAVLPGMVGGEAGDNTTFGSLHATFTITDGVLRNDDLLLKTRLAPVSGAGTLNLAARTINYRAVAEIAGRVKVPIQVGGTFEHPTYRPELGGTIEQLRGLVPGAGNESPAGNPANLLRRLLPR